MYVVTKATKVERLKSIKYPLRTCKSSTRNKKGNGTRTVGMHHTTGTTHTRGIVGGGKVQTVAVAVAKK